jgi:2,3-diketo-5-methylthio-1-phosphopentane phosphatase
MQNSILISDFDGTITRYDFYDLVCRRFPEILLAGHWQKYEAGEISHFEALRRIFAEIRTEEKELLQIVDEMQVDSCLAGSVNRLQQNGWEIAVASAGCDWYIRKILSEAGVDILVHANPGRFSRQEGLVMELPKQSMFFSPELGINKVAVVRDALKRSSCVAFAGDGRPDLPAALLVEPKQRFARKWLATKLREIGEPFQAFERWSEIAERLLKE